MPSTYQPEPVPDLMNGDLTEERTVQVARAPRNGISLEDTAINTPERIGRIQVRRRVSARTARARGHVGNVVQVERCSVALSVSELEVVERRVVEPNGHLVVDRPSSARQCERDVVRRKAVD